MTGLAIATPAPAAKDDPMSMRLATLAFVPDPTATEPLIGVGRAGPTAAAPGADHPATAKGSNLFSTLLNQLVRTTTETGEPVQLLATVPLDTFSETSTGQASPAMTRRPPPHGPIPDTKGQTKTSVTKTPAVDPPRPKHAEEASGVGAAAPEQVVQSTRPLIAFTSPLPGSPLTTPPTRVPPDPGEAPCAPTTASLGQQAGAAVVRTAPSAAALRNAPSAVTVGNAPNAVTVGNAPSAVAVSNAPSAVDVPGRFNRVQPVATAEAGITPTGETDATPAAAVHLPTAPAPSQSAIDPGPPEHFRQMPDPERQATRPVAAHQDVTTALVPDVQGTAALPAQAQAQAQAQVQVQVQMGEPSPVTPQAGLPGSAPSVRAPSLSSPVTEPPADTLTAPAAVGEQVGVAVLRLTPAADGTRRISLQLTPKALGRVDILVDQPKHGPVTITVTVQNQQTLSLLRADHDALSQALDRAGFAPMHRTLTLQLAGPDLPTNPAHPPAPAHAMSQPAGQHAPQPGIATDTNMNSQDPPANGQRRPASQPPLREADPTAQSILVSWPIGPTSAPHTQSVGLNITA